SCRASTPSCAMRAHVTTRRWPIASSQKRLHSTVESWADGIAVTIHNYLLFISACIALALVPGPDMAYMLARCIAQGRRAGVLAALGFNLGGFVHVTAAALGLSAVLASSSTAFTAVKWLGAAYLIYLGIGAIRSQPQQIAIAEGVPAGPGRRTILWQAFLS